MSEYKIGDHVLVIGQPEGLEDFDINIIGKILMFYGHPPVAVSIEISGRVSFSYSLDSIQPLDPNTASYLEWKEDT